MDETDLRFVINRVRILLRRAREPLSLESIATMVPATTAEVHEVLAYRLHGFVKMEGGKYSWL